MAVALVVAMRRGDIAREAPDDQAVAVPSGIPPGHARVVIESAPSGALIVRAGQEVGLTPHAVTAEVGTTVRVHLSKPGYAAIVREVVVDGAGAAMRATLPAVRGFEGTWQQATGALRYFARNGNRVAAFRTDLDGSRELLRLFEFTRSPDERVVFAATETHPDARAPNEPSCILHMLVEYRYQAAHDRLHIRREEVNYRFDANNKTCHVVGRSKRAWEPLTRHIVSDAAPSRHSTAVAEGTGPLAPPRSPRRKRTKKNPKKNRPPQQLQTKRPPAAQQQQQQNNATSD